LSISRDNLHLYFFISSIFDVYNIASSQQNFPSLRRINNQHMKFLLIALFSLPLLVQAQNKLLLVEGETPNLFLDHKVAPKENYYSIGRIYNVSPKEVAPFNNLVLENGLSLGQRLKIPLVASNFLQLGEALEGEVLVPLYHIVNGKESLYKISTLYNKVPIETLKKWNSLKANGIANGTKLIVGYLKIKKELSPLSNMAKVKPADEVTSKVEAAVKPVVVAKEPINSEPIKPVETAKKTAGVNLPVAEKVSTEPIATKVVKEAAPVNQVPKTVGLVKDFKGGVFKSDYEEQVRKGELTFEKGEVGLFKSNSGWEDGKYYCLHNSSNPGTIIKITSNLTGISVYAKVLDLIPDIKQNSGLLIIISNAAAQELGMGDGKFDCSLSYKK
jgi:LysM repeat protein